MKLKKDSLAKGKLHMKEIKNQWNNLENLKFLIE